MKTGIQKSIIFIENEIRFHKISDQMQICQRQKFMRHFFEIFPGAF